MTLDRTRAGVACSNLGQNAYLSARFEAVMALIFQVQVEDFWVVTPCNDVVGYQRFEGPCCLHLQTWKPSETFTALIFQVRVLLGCDIE
jgi:hypothetical protein